MDTMGVRNTLSEDFVRALCMVNQIFLTFLYKSLKIKIVVVPSQILYCRFFLPIFRILTEKTIKKSDASSSPPLVS